MIPIGKETKVRDIIFPLANTTMNDGVIRFEKHIATAFFIGKRGYAITAAHVIEQLTLENCHALFLDNATNEWLAFKIGKTEKHPIEDIAIIEIIGRPQQSSYVISATEHQATTDYEVWGYPIYAAEELKNSRKSPDEPYERPDLSYSKGYITRRISREMAFSIYHGSLFYELSCISGDGCSGGPVTTPPNKLGSQEVIGIYVGSHHEKGLATRISTIASWIPSILGISIKSESEEK